jgi:hypothetical protein
MRTFKIGTALIVEDETTVALTNEQVRDHLRFTHPEVATATIRANDPDGEGNALVEFLPAAQRKG